MRRRTKETRRCLEIIESFQEQRFEDLPCRSDLDPTEVTSIWENPERLCDPDDFSLLFHVLSHQITSGNYDDPLEVCTTIVKSTYSDRELVKERVSEMFTFLLTQLLKEEKRKRIDYHVILSWLEAGDLHFCKENHTVVLNRKTYAVLKAIHLVKTWKSKHECYSCGCVQKQIIELFRGNNCSRLFEALHSIVKSRVIDLNPTFKRIFKSVSSDIQHIDCFCYFTEILQELRQCAAIDPSDEKSPSLLIQLTGLMWEMKPEDVPKACLEMHRLLVSNGDGKEKQKSAVEMVLKSKLIPKIFECLNNSRELRLDGFNRGYLQKFVDVVEKESYSTQKSHVFAPLQLLNLLYNKYEIWTKTKQFIISRTDSLNLSTQQGPVIVIYLLSVIYRHDSSLIDHLVGILEKQYSKNVPGSKNRVLLILEIAEKLGSSNPSFSTYFKENRVKTKLLLSTELDSSENVELVFEYLPDLNPQEFNQFLQSKAQSLADKSWDELFRRIKYTDVCVTSDDVWQCALERKNSEQDVIEFIENQLKRLVTKKERGALGIRMGQVFTQLRSVSTSTKLPPRELLLAIPEILISFPAAQYSLFPQNTTSSLIPVLILSFCFFSDRNEQKVTKMFQSFLTKVKRCDEAQAESSADSIQIMEEICEVVKSGKSAGCDLQFMRQSTSGGSETFMKTINDVCTDESLRNSFPNPESFARVKERIVEMCSVLFGTLALQIQVLGDRAKTPFCQLALIIDKFITLNLPSSAEHSIIWKIAERAACGYSCFIEKKWNALFVVPRVMTLLSSSRNHVDLLKRLLGILQKNQALLLHLQKKPDFTELENLANQ